MSSWFATAARAWRSDSVGRSIARTNTSSLGSPPTGPGGVATGVSFSAGLGNFLHLVLLAHGVGRVVVAYLRKLAARRDHRHGPAADLHPRHRLARRRRGAL